MIIWKKQIRYVMWRAVFGKSLVDKTAHWSVQVEVQLKIGTYTF